jgi:hypothetical protein
MVTLDRGTEFMAEFSNMMVEDYGVQKKPITKRNPQAKAIVERVHQTIGNIMIRTFSIADNPDITDNDPWTGIFNAVAFAVRATVHTTTQATPMQLVFGSRDAILNIQMEANWKRIKERKQALIISNNKQENSKQYPHTYSVGDQILIRKDWDSKYDSDAYKGPYEIVEVRSNVSLNSAIDCHLRLYNCHLVRP